MTGGDPHRPLPRARRELGQNFLVNAGVRDKILAALAPGPEDWVVEIGPGPGALTAPLTERAARVVAVEIDPRLAEELAGRVARPEALQVHRGDGADLDYAAIRAEAGRPLLVVGNLPFNAAGPILRRALEHPGPIARLVLMFQKEVAQRLTASPGRRSYGLLSVVTQQRSHVERLFEVSPGSFRPVPKVAAGVVRLTPIVPGLRACCLEAHDRLVRQAFAHRRKTLRNNLRSGPFPWEAIEGWLGLEGLRPDQRAEEVPVPIWARLAERTCAGPHPGSGSPGEPADG